MTSNELAQIGTSEGLILINHYTLPTGVATALFRSQNPPEGRTDVNMAYVWRPEDPGYYAVEKINPAAYTRYSRPKNAPRCVQMARVKVG